MTPKGGVTGALAIYPRATNYPNQLHIVGEGRVRIYSFANEEMP